MGRTRRWLTRAVLGAAIILVGAACEPAVGPGGQPTGFREVTVISGLINPTVVRFASDGRVFVAEKRGVVKVFDDLSDTTPTTFVDLRSQVHNFWDRGLLGMALDPHFPTRPYVYVLYTRDATIGAPAPRWGTRGANTDGCPTPPGATDDGCVVSGRLSRLTVGPGNQMTAEKVLVDGWCQQYPSHSIGTLQFDLNGALYAGAGDGSAFTLADWGQRGSPLNPCGDPPGGVGGVESPPTAEGGSLRSQDLRTSGDPVTLDGTIIRIAPDTGAGVSDNPLASDPDVNARRIVAYGLRNPFRFTFRPGSREMWIGDVGWNTVEELNRLNGPLTMTNFGWPCYEGNSRQSGYDSADLNVCENLYATPSAVQQPYWSYNHADPVVAGDTCGTGGSSISGVTFYGGGTYPSSYQGALFFADYSRNCIWVMSKKSSGLPDPTTRRVFKADAAAPIDLEIGPGGDLFYVDFTGGTIRRIRYSAGNRPPVVNVTASPSTGPHPLTVSFDAGGSTDPDPGDALTYEWDLDDDGVYGDATGPTASYTYATAGVRSAWVRVTDSLGESTSGSVQVRVDSTPPEPVIDTPASALEWGVGESISFSGHADDPQDGALPASALTWSLILHHCTTPDACHSHPIQDYEQTTSGSFVAPDHDYPSYLELRLTATDSTNLQSTTSVRLDPRTVDLTVDSSPAGVPIAVGGTSVVTPGTRTMIVGSTTSVTAPSPVDIGGTSYVFSAWSDGGARSHFVTAGSGPSSLSATYQAQSG